jgi:hypothetical protein
MSNRLYACITKDALDLNVTKKHKSRKLNSRVVQAAFLKAVAWPKGSVIKIAFVRGPIMLPDGNATTVDPEFTQDKADWVKATVEKYLVPFLGTIKITWDVSINESDVRITFVKDAGAFSLLGVESKTAPKNTATMNLGWLDKDQSDTDKNPELTGTGVVVVHEFGHMLGMIHEHQRGDAPLDWNKPVVYRAMATPPNSWDKETTDEQIFKQVEMSTLNASRFDPFSVMEYIFPDSFFKTPPKLQHTKYLSNLDIVWICKLYNDGKLPPGVNEDGTGTNPFGGATGNGEDLDSQTSWLQKNWYWLFLIIFFGFLIIFFWIKMKARWKTGRYAPTYTGGYNSMPSSEQSSEQFSEQSSEQFSEQSSEQFSEQFSEQSATPKYMQPNRLYV